MIYGETNGRRWRVEERDAHVVVECPTGGAAEVVRVDVRDVEVVIAALVRWRESGEGGS